MRKTDRNLLTPYGYAKHRRCSRTAVTRAIKEKRISTIDGRIDPAVADAEWKANTRPRVQEKKTGSKTEPVSDPLSYADARARREAAEARLAELKLAEEEGLVVRVADVETWWVRQTGSARQRLLAIPARVASQVHGLKTPAEAHAVIEAAVFEALEELSRDGAPPPLQP